VFIFGLFELALRSHDDTATPSNPGVNRGLIAYTTDLNTAMKRHLEMAAVLKGT
jgi:hypothetical protein